MQCHCKLRGDSCNAAQQEYQCLGLCRKPAQLSPAGGPACRSLACHSPTGPYQILLLGKLQQDVLLTSRLQRAEQSCMSAWDALKACREEQACSYMGCMATQVIGVTPLSDPPTKQMRAQKPLLLMWRVLVCCLCTAQVATKHRLPFLPLWNLNCQLIQSQRAESSLDGSRKVVINHARQSSFSQLELVTASLTQEQQFCLELAPRGDSDCTKMARAALSAMFSDSGLQ